MRFIHICRFVFPLFVLAAPPGLAAADNWIYAATERFEILSSAPERESRQLLINLEQFRANFLAAFPIGPAHEPRTTIVLFGRDRQFRPYKPLYKGRPKDIGGIFIGGPDEVVMALTTDTEDEEFDNPAETILHEYLHLLVHTRGLEIPLWLNEGLAELYSTFKFDGKVTEFGHPKPIYLFILSESALMPLARLFAVTTESPEYNEENRAGMFYAQSWALVHYLVCGPDRQNPGRLAKFIARVGSEGGATEAAFREIFGVGYDEMQRRLRGHLQSGEYLIRRAPSVLPNDAIAVNFRTATSDERDLALLNLKWRVRGGAARSELVQWAQRQPNSPRASELLGVVAAEQGDGEAAIRHWQRAAELNSTNPFVYVELAQHTMRAYLPDLNPGVVLPDEAIQVARRWIDRAVSLSPHYADAFETLAWIEACAPTMRIPALNSVQKAVAGMRKPGRTLFALAVTRWRLDDAETSRKILDNLLAATDLEPDLQSSARALRDRVLRESSVSAVQDPVAPSGSRQRSLSSGSKDGVPPGLVHVAMAIMAEQRGDISAAVEAYGRAAAEDVSNAEVFWRRGLTKRSMGDRMGALSDFDTAIELAPDDHRFYLSRGNTKADYGEIEPGIADLNRAAALKPDRGDIFVSRGFALHNRGDVVAAVADYERALALSGDKAICWANRANARMELGDWDAALADYERVIETGQSPADYCVLYRAFLRKRLEPAKPAPDIAKEVLAWPAGWVKTIGMYVIGRLDETAFLAAAARGEPRTASLQQSEALYFAGMKQLLFGGDAVAAAAHFRRCVEMRRVDRDAFNLARSELKRLDAASQP